MVNVSWNVVGVLELDGVVHLWLGILQRVSPELCLGLFNRLKVLVPGILTIFPHLRRPLVVIVPF